MLIVTEYVPAAAVVHHFNKGFRFRAAEPVRAAPKVGVAAACRQLQGFACANWAVAVHTAAGFRNLHINMAIPFATICIGDGKVIIAGIFQRSIGNLRILRIAAKAIRAAPEVAAVALRRELNGGAFANGAVAGGACHWRRIYNHSNLRRILTAVGIGDNDLIIAGVVCC